MENTIQTHRMPVSSSLGVGAGDWFSYLASFSKPKIKEGALRGCFSWQDLAT